MEVAIQPAVAILFTAEQRHRLSRVFEDADELLLSYVEGLTGAEPERLLALMFALRGAGAALLTYYVYHCEDHPIEILPIERGLPREGIYCRECERAIDASELTYDVACRTASLLHLTFDGGRDG